MYVILVRHGKAGVAATDEERPLTDKGREQAEQQGRVLKKLGWGDTEVWHSPLVRARETAELMAAASGSSLRLVERDGLLPGDGVRHMADQLAAANDDVMLVGHMPYMNYLASHLVTGDDMLSEWHFKTGTMLLLQREGRGTWTVEWFVHAGVKL